MGRLIAADPASKVAYTITDMETAGKALDLGYILLRDDGVPGKVQAFEGGVLLDGAPLNVYLFDRWYAGQAELLMPFWESGEIPLPDASLRALMVEQMPEAEREKYEAYKAAESSWGWGTYALIGAAGLLLWRFVR